MPELPSGAKGDPDASQRLKGLHWRVLTSSGYPPSGRQNKGVPRVSLSRSANPSCPIDPLCACASLQPSRPISWARPMGSLPA